MQKLMDKKGLLLLALLLLPIINTQASDTGALATTLLLKPARCVALHQGQVCYQTLKIHWRTPEAADYCLYQKDNPTALRCWEGATNGEMVYEFSSVVSTSFHLMRKADTHSIAEAAIEVAWVYNSNRRRKSHWRVF